MSVLIVFLLFATSKWSLASVTVVMPLHYLQAFIRSMSALLVHFSAVLTVIPPEVLASFVFSNMLLSKYFNIEIAAHPRHILLTFVTVLVHLLIECCAIFSSVFRAIAERPGTHALLTKLILALLTRTCNMKAALRLSHHCGAVIASNFVLLQVRVTYSGSILLILVAGLTLVPLYFAL